MKHVEKIKWNNQVRLNMHERQSRWVKDHANQSRYLNEDTNVPQQVNYLANSNNIHEVLQTADAADNRNPNTFLRPPRSGSNSPNNSHSLTRAMDMSRTGANQQQPVPIGGHYHFQKDNQATTSLAQSMQAQAMDFVGVLKVLIEDTVLQQRRINDEMFSQVPRPASYPYPQTTNLGGQPPFAQGLPAQDSDQNYHYQQQLEVNHLVE